MKSESIVQKKDKKRENHLTKTVIFPRWIFKYVIINKLRMGVGVDGFSVK